MTDPSPLDIARAALTGIVDRRTALRAALLDQDGAIDAALSALNQYRAPDLPFRVVAADGTGNSLANAALQREMDLGGIVWVGAGRYLIDTEVMLALRSGLILLLHPLAELIGKPNAVKRSYVLSGRDVTDAMVAGGRIRGDRLSHVYGLVDGKPSTHEWCMGVGLTRCKRVTVRDLHVSECAGDGLSITGEDLAIFNVTSTWNRRQGMSIYSGRGIRVIGGEYSNTGAMGTNPGTKPMAGIDMEPDTGLLEDVLFSRVRAIDNGTSDLLAYCNSKVQGIRNVRIEDCTVVGGPNGIETQSAGAGRIDVTALRNTLGAHRRGAAFKVGAGSSVAIGSADAADANGITGVAARKPVEFQLLGTDARTANDIRVLTGGTATVGVNRYLSPAA